MHRHPLPVLVLGFLALLPFRASAQAGGLDAYYRAAGEHFGVTEGEVQILSDWNLPPEEVPVVLFVARRGGVSADAVAALRRSGKSWADLGSRYGVHAGMLHVELDGAADLGLLAHAYDEYRQQPSSAWPGIRLDDPEIVALVNLRFLMEALRRSPEEVLAAMVRAGSAPDAYRLLVRGG